jgi:ferredoxin-NADP reductase
MRWRPALLVMHRWVGLTVGMAFLLLAVTGGVLVMRGHFEDVLNRRYVEASSCAAPLSLDALSAIASRAHPVSRLAGVQVDPRPGRSIAVQFEDKDFVYLDPCSGSVLGVQNEYGGFAGTLDYLHRFRFIAAGRGVAGWLNLAAALMLVLVGIVIWWPRTRAAWRPALTYDRSLPGTARTLSLHRVFGIYGAALLLVMTITAIPLSFPWAKGLIGAATHSSTESPEPPMLGAAQAPRPISMQRAWENVRAVMPATQWAMLRYPKRGSGVIVAETLERGVPHEEANSYVFLDAATAAPIKIVPYATGVSKGRKIYLLILALHSGLVGGIAYQLALMLACFAVPVQAYSGAVPYIRRKLRRPPKSGLRLRLVGRHPETPTIAAFEFVDADGGQLPAFSAGSHVDLCLPSGLVRQYSLCNDPEETHRYAIAVLREAHSRGGSVALHDDLAIGDVLEASLPRNHFPLAHAAPYSLLIAGGIGITPLLCMAERLGNSHAPFDLHYCVRSADEIAFAGRIRGSVFADRVHVHAGDQGTRLDVEALIGALPAGGHIYVCGPARLIDAVLAAAAAAGIPDERMHREYFAAGDHDTTADRPFDVVIASTGAVIPVGRDESVVQSLARHGIDIPTSCSEGICGTCITRILDGEVDHRDMLFSAAERARHDRFTPCCSRASGPSLVLDL